MGKRTASLERQHEAAKDRLSKCEAALTDAGKDAEAMRRDPTWRRRRADCRTLARRLHRARTIESFNQVESES